MIAKDTSLAEWPAEQVALGRQWIATWKRAGEAMEKLRRAELRRLNPERAIPLLCGKAD